ncbi:hypothetical protein [Levilactobacillus namurensis]|uniref:hypothetical protein n=1 Tax=Levilactobacillus namurensis TaxID=380393 RepID=UPI000464D586|nr:hypothetical protein [Levilactobacillus namurensis]
MFFTDKIDCQKLPRWWHVLDGVAHWAQWVLIVGVIALFWVQWPWLEWVTAGSLIITGAWAVATYVIARREYRRQWQASRGFKSSK